jgi:excisionase family DNA binding protein
MFWTVFERISLMMGSVLLGKQIADFFSDDSDINPNSIYSPEEIASILSVEKVDVVSWIKRGQLKAWRTHGLYRILGKNVLSLLAGIDNEEIMFESLKQDSLPRGSRAIVLIDKENRKFLFGGQGADHEMRN